MRRIRTYRGRLGEETLVLDVMLDPTQEFVARGLDGRLLIVVDPESARDGSVVVNVDPGDPVSHADHFPGGVCPVPDCRWGVPPRNPGLRSG